MRPLLRSLLSALVLATLVALVPAPAGAALVFFDTLGTVGDVYDDTDTFFYIGEYSLIYGGDDDWFQGERFTSKRTGFLYSIEVAVGHLLTPETIEFRLYADNGGTLGALLETIYVPTVAENYDGAIETALAAGTTELTKGTSYWLMATCDAPSIWFSNEIGADPLPRLWTPGGVGGSLNSDTTTATAFRLNGPPDLPALGDAGQFVTALLLLLAASLTLRSSRPSLH
jgi:hypothetical protein